MRYFIKLSAVALAEIVATSTPVATWMTKRCHIVALRIVVNAGFKTTGIPEERVKELAKEIKQ